MIDIRDTLARSAAAACLAMIAALVTFLACTIEVQVPKPTIEVQCVEIILPGGQVNEVCPDGGADDAGDAE